MILLLDKPTGFTSYDLIRKLKKLYPGEKIGHAGTLDPLATGLMVVAIGKDTKRLSTFVGLDKTYLATIDFSLMTDTWDVDYWQESTTLATVNGTIETITGATRPYPPEREISQYLTSILGTHALPLTPFSAKKWKGKKLYEYARAGEPVFIDIDMELIAYEIIAYDFPQLIVRLHVGSGTYIRSIAHWLGKQMHVGGVLTGLRRERVGERRVP